MARSALICFCVSGRSSATISSLVLAHRGPLHIPPRLPCLGRSHARARTEVTAGLTSVSSIAAAAARDRVIAAP